MVNIDLKTTQGGSLETRTSTDTSLVVVLLITVIVIAVYGGLYLWGKSIEKNIAKTDSDINSEMDKLNGQNAKAVIDFQNRLKISGDLIKNQGGFLTGLAEVEKDVLPGVYLNDLSFDKSAKTYSMDIVANGYTDIAKQLFIFKQDNFFSGAVGGASQIDSQGKADMKITLNVN